MYEYVPSWLVSMNKICELYVKLGWINPIPNNWKTHGKRKKVDNIVTIVTNNTIFNYRYKTT